MPKFGSSDYQPIEKYLEALGIFHNFIVTLLFEFAREPRSIKDTIIRNFFARTDMTMRGIFELWKIEDYQDCWILHRCLLDRLFHLHELHEKNEFEIFESWSFLQQYNAINRVRSDPEFGGAKAVDLFNLTDEQVKRAQSLSDSPPTWHRPKPKSVAKAMDMTFLYRFGYDYGSTHVHPMANDGDQDFYSITGLEPKPDYPDQISVISNTLLHGTMIIQTGLNASSESPRVSWRLHLLRGWSHEHTKAVSQRVEGTSSTDGARSRGGV
ncbi:MAG: DUF5677 domain-containing protein, partial [Actinobacteria bacterium]|nr:DUF5677 domain-containing protein [Actinomycetota bacterium]